ncbi:hypothetical protein KAI46_16250 [bacterium]|nr:hypothetical protein [bacterium]
MTKSTQLLNPNDFIAKAPGPVISYDEAEVLSGGLIKKKSMQNLCSQGLGPKRIRLGKRVGFVTVDFCEWLCDRLQAA